ncbi:MAG: HD domain-containing protein [Candidatus Nanopelagicales bacterium]
MTEPTGTTLGPRFVAAVDYATAVHSAQRRKGTDVPYASHLLAVAALVLEAGGDEDAAVAALLHDAAEDHGGRPRLADIRDRFGERVAAVVEGCSDSLTEEPGAKEPWPQRKARYVAHLRDPHVSDEVLLVAAADKAHNASATAVDVRLDPGAWARFNATPGQIVRYYADCLAAFEQRGVPEVLTARLRAAVDDLDRLPRIPASAGALVWDRAGRLLVLNPTYKKGWTIPGGIVEDDGETPWQACVREVREETALEARRGRLVCVDFRPPRPGRPGGLRFLFDLGTYDDDALAAIALQPEEVCEHRLLPVRGALPLLSGPVRRRVRAALRKGKRPRYLEDGRSVDRVR